MDWRQEEALWRYSLIREASDTRLSCAERGALVRSLAARLHAHPSGELRSVGRSTLDDWIRAYRAGGFAALQPRQRASVPRTPRALLEQAERLRRENPARTAAQIQRIIAAVNGGSGPSQSTVERHLRRVGLTRAGLRGERQAFGRFEASMPNELWVADCLHGPMVEGRRAILFAVVDDHSRAVVGAQFCHAESTVRLESVLRSAFQRRGVPGRLYVDFVPRNKINVLFPRRLCARQPHGAADHGERQHRRRSTGHITVTARRASAAAFRRSARLA
jgi:putative transposase